MTYAPIQGKCPACHQDSANTSFQAGAASRDAEVVSLTNQRDYEYVRAENAEQERDQLRAELEYDQRNAAMSQSESARLLDENTKLRAELAAALAACKAKDEAILQENYSLALSFQPDDSALKAWLGEPVAWKHDDPKRHDAITDSVKELLQRANSEYMHRPIDKTEHYTIPLYSPKGLK